MVSFRRRAALGLLGAGAALLFPPPGAAALRLLTPADGALTSAPAIHLVYTASEPVRVELDGALVAAEPRSVPSGDGAAVVHTRLPLAPGSHRVRLLPADDVVALAEVRVSRSPPGSAATAPGSAFHTAAGEAACSGCHLFPGADGALPDGADTAAQVCAPCHGDVGRSPHVHGPAAVGACLTCHTTAYGSARFSPAPARDSCGACHVELMARILGGEPYAHGPAAAGACTACHEPHGGASPDLLRAPVPELCFGCHGEAVTRPVASTLHGKLDCTRCHSPHGGATPLLTSAPGNRFCVTCHDAIDPVEPGHPFPGHPVAGAPGTGRDSGPMRCESCHPPHGTRDVSHLAIADNEVLQRRFCTGCHPL